MQIELIEAEANGDQSRLRGVALSPVRRADPITQFSATVSRFNAQCNGANKSDGRLRNRECRQFVSSPRRSVRTNPRLGHSILVWMGNMQGRKSNLVDASQPLNCRCISH